MFGFSKPNTYVLGTGRSGTKTLAELYNGLHEPKPYIIEEATQYYLGNLKQNDKLLELLKERSELEANVISDNKQSLVVPMIQKVDPKARFILLIREPVSCIESFYARSAYSDDELSKASDAGKKYVENRLIPAQGFPNNWTSFMKSTWYWYEINRVVLSSTPMDRLDILFTHELPKGKSNTHNASKQPQVERLQEKKKKGLSKDEKKLLEETALPLWETIKAYRDKAGYNGVGVLNRL